MPLPVQHYAFGQDRGVQENGKEEAFAVRKREQERRRRTQEQLLLFETLLGIYEKRYLAGENFLDFTVKYSIIDFFCIYNRQKLFPDPEKCKILGLEYTYF